MILAGIVATFQCEVPQLNVFLVLYFGEGIGRWPVLDVVIDHHVIIDDVVLVVLSHLLGEGFSCCCIV